MQNLKMYLIFKKDISFKQHAFNELDALVFSLISYIRWEGVVSENSDKISLQEACRKHQTKYSYKELSSSYQFSLELIDLIELLMDCKRYEDVMLSYYRVKYEPDTLTQFSATYISIKNNLSYISYRGTDNSILGWKENFRLIYSTQLEAHQYATDYFEEVMEKEHKYRFLPWYYNTHSIYLGGHSKGGNLAMAAAYKTKKMHNGIKQVFAFDSPGFLPSFYELYENKQIANRIINYVPNCSMFGRFLDHHEKMNIVKSQETLLSQHDTFSWVCESNRFIRSECFDEESDEVKEYVNRLLYEGDLTVKEETLYKMFDILDKMELNSLSDFNSIKIGQGIQGIKELATMNSGQRKFFLDFSMFVLKQTKNIILSSIK